MLRSELSNNNERILPLDSTLSQQFPTKIFGNRCGHTSNNFRRPTYIRDTKRRSHSIQEAMRRLIYSETHRYYFPQLGQIIYNANRGGRLRRSEFREAATALILSALLKDISLYAMAFGYFDNQEKFHYYNYERLKNVTGLSDKRICSVMKRLQELEIVKVTRILDERENGKIITKKVIIKLTDKIFEMLELTNEFLKDRQDDTVKHQKIEARLNKKRKQLECFKPRSKFITKTKPITSNVIKRVPKAISNGFSPETNRQVAGMCLSLLKSHPHLGSKERYALACQKIGVPPPQ